MAASARSKSEMAPATARTAAKRPSRPSAASGPTWSPGSEAEAGRPLEPHTLQAMESRFGHDFGRVRIHTGPEADRSADGLGAHAFTLGMDVHFGAGRYKPDTPAGRNLLVHELEHVVRAGPRGPAVPKLQPKDAVNHEENIVKIFRLPGNRDTKLRQYLEAHPDSLATAERLLVSWSFKGKNENSVNVKAALMSVLAKRDPGSTERVAEMVRKRTELLQKETLRSYRRMWTSYEAAAYAHAWLAWTEERLGKKPKPAEKRLLEALRKSSQTRFNDAAQEHESLLRYANMTLDALMDASDTQPTLQLDVLRETSDVVQGGLGEARRERIHSYDDVNTMKKYPSAERDFYRAEGAFFKAKAEEKEAEARRTSLEPPAGTKAAAPAPELKEARKAAKAAGVKKDQAKTARDLRSKELDQWQEAEIRLRGETRRRDAKIKETLPADVQDPDVKLSDLLDEDQKWWIYHKALNNLGTGFASGSKVIFHEKTTGNILSHRSKLASNRRSLGVDYEVAVSTYEKHGEGQYDIYSHAGKNVNAAVPEQVDLALVLGRRLGKTSGPRLFQHVSSGVLSASPVDQNAADDSVLAKLIHGYFGFESWDKKKREAYLKGDRQGLPTPNPDATRILGGLTFDKTLSGNDPSPDVAADVEAIRNALDAALRKRLKALTPPVDVKEAILNFVHANEKDFSAGKTISAAAYEAFYAIPGNFPVPGKPGVKSAYTEASAAAAVYAAARKTVLEDATVSDPLLKLIARLLEKGLQGNRGGPSMTLTHKYHEVNGNKDAWIQVYYGHMHDVTQAAHGAAVKQGDPLGQVGSSGNSVSPHVHMGIAVYDKEPRYGVPPIGFLVPLDFFPFWQAKEK
ncbi:MAG: DUF4157 domain-containing protein [Acidobacteriota bacterium]